MALCDGRAWDRAFGRERLGNSGPSAAANVVLTGNKFAVANGRYTISRALTYIGAGVTCR